LCLHRVQLAARKAMACRLAAAPSNQLPVLVSAQEANVCHCFNCTFRPKSYNCRWTESFLPSFSRKHVSKARCCPAPSYRELPTSVQLDIGLIMRAATIIIQQRCRRNAVAKLMARAEQRLYEHSRASSATLERRRQKKVHIKHVPLSQRGFTHGPRASLQHQRQVSF
jgi:hypothetical protein